MQKTVTYFEKNGPENTGDCLEITKKAASELNCRNIVIASTNGDTGKIFAEGMKDLGLNIVIVTHSQGFKEPNTIELTDKARSAITAAGATIYTGTMITHSLETSLAKSFSGVYPTLLVAQTLRIFGQGTKVCCEMIMMAADAGLIPEGEEVLAIAGTGHGADTVILLRAVPSKRFLDLRVLETLAKPRG